MTKIRYLWPEEVAERTGMSVPSLAKRLSDVKRKHAAGTATPADLPLPADYKQRQRSQGHHMVTVTSPRWRERDIDAWLPVRRPAHRPRKNPEEGK